MVKRNKAKRTRSASKQGVFFRLWSDIAAFFGDVAYNIRRRRARKPERVKTVRGGLIPGGNSILLIGLDIVLLLCILASACFCYLTLKGGSGIINVTVSADGLTGTYKMEEGASVSALLEKAGISLSAEDVVEPQKSATLSEGDRVAVTRAFPVAVESAGSITLMRLSGGTVGDALDAAEVSYDVDDDLSHLTFEDLVPGMQIRHTNVETEYDTTHKTLNYQEVLIKDDEKYDDFREVEVEGSDGLKRVTQRITIKNGMEVSREIVDQTILTPAVDEQIRVGVKIRYQTNYEGEWRRAVDKPVAGKNGWVEMTVYRATGYCTGNRTATGTRPALGTLAVNPKIIPYGTKVWVPKYGMCTAVDTGAFRNYPAPRNTAIDLWFNTRREAMRWGSKYNYTILVKMG